MGDGAAVGAAGDGTTGDGGDGETGEGAKVPREAQVYVDAKTYVYLEIELHKPLIPRRPASVLADRYMYMCIHESSSLAWMGPNQHLLAPQTHNPFFPSN